MIGAVVLLVLLVLAAPATPSTVVGVPSKDFRFDGRVTFTAAPGETNHVQVSATGSSSVVRVVDVGSVMAARGFCRVVDAHTVECHAEGYTFSKLRLRAGDGDGDDDVTADAIALDADGGPGDDVLRVVGTQVIRSTLDGGGGRDELHGGDAADLLMDGDAPGAADADVLEGGGSGPSLDNRLGDVVSYAGRTAALEVHLAPDGTAGEAGEVDRLLGIEAVVGGEGPDRMTGDAGSTELDGGSGDDHLDGGGGGDVLTGGDGDDTVASGGAPTGTLPYEVLHGGDGADTLIGGPGADLITPGAGRDEVRAAGGADVIRLDTDDGDRVLCGGGEDFVDRFDARSDVAADCEAGTVADFPVHLVLFQSGDAVVVVIDCPEESGLPPATVVTVRRAGRVLARRRLVLRRSMCAGPSQHRFRVPLNGRGRRLNARSPGARVRVAFRRPGVIPASALVRLRTLVSPTAAAGPRRPRGRRATGLTRSASADPSRRSTRSPSRRGARPAGGRRRSPSAGRSGRCPRRRAPR